MTRKTREPAKGSHPAVSKNIPNPYPPLDPSLCAQGADNWDRKKRLMMAKTFERWSNQLRSFLRTEAPLTKHAGLNRYAGKLDAQERRTLAKNLQRDAFELYLSAELMDRCEKAPVMEDRQGCAEMLKKAGDLERRANALRDAAFRGLPGSYGPEGQRLRSDLDAHSYQN